MTDSYLCACCGKLHEGLATSFAADYPDNYAKMSLEDREARSIIGSDQCIIDASEFYIRGCLEIPIHGDNEPFVWGLWANLWEHDYDSISEHWETIGRENLIGPFKGRLGNSLALYSSTANLKLKIRVEAVGRRPSFFVEEADHPLAKEQAAGISLETARRYSCLLMRVTPFTATA